MSDIKLFRLAPDGVREVPSTSVAVEKSLQTLIEGHLDSFLGVRFLASEYSTGKTHGGRIDTLGIDENNAPVIIEYKRALNENVINQGLYYLNWLMDHRAEVQLLVLEHYGKDVGDAIAWEHARLVCIAGDFIKFDVHAVREIPRTIDLIRYRRYGDDLLLLELVASTPGHPPGWATVDVTPRPRVGDEPRLPDGTPVVIQRLAKLPIEAQDRYQSLRSFLFALGDEVQERTVNQYVSFRRLKNFAYVQFRTKTNAIVVSVKIDPRSIELEPGFTSVDSPNAAAPWTSIHIRTDDDLERAKPLLVQSYEAS